jgi:hypothetical protein
MDYRKVVFPLLVVALGIAAFFPLHNLILVIAQGDHGRDLYAFWEVSRGRAPYRDFLWIYGPLMPYYYGTIFTMGGPTIQTALWGEIILKIACGVIFYAILALWCSRIFSVVGALWLFAFFPHFSHTFNHSGGLPAELLVLYFLLRYFQQPRWILSGLGLFAVFLLCLIKLNFGIVLLAGFLASQMAFDGSIGHFRKNLRLYCWGVLGLGVAVAAAYSLLTRGLPRYYLLQCFPVFKAYRQYDLILTSSIFGTSVALLRQSISGAGSSPFHLATGALFWFCCFWESFGKAHPLPGGTPKKTLMLSYAAILLFLVLSLSEYVLSGIDYSVLWAKPFQELLVFAVIGVCLRRFPRWARVAVILFLAIVPVSHLVRQDRVLNAMKVPIRYFQMEEQRVYTTNSPRWFLTVFQTTAFLRQELRPDEQFFALPYDPLFYFLLRRQSPVRELCFFDLMNIPPEQEREIMARLEAKRINYVVLSNRVNSDERGLGTFGKTYCPLLAAYLKENFKEIQSFGTWSPKPRWIENYGIKILKRK